MTLLPFISIKLTHKDFMDQEGATSAQATTAQAPNAQAPGAHTTGAQATDAQAIAAQITLETGEPSQILRHAQKILISVVTIGPLLDQRIRELNQARDPLGGYLLDCAGLAALKKAGTLVCRLAEKQALSRNWGVGYQVGPGGTQGWPLKDQAKVCSLVSLDPIGVKIDAQGGLSPFKTISSLIPIGPGYKRKTVGSTCRYCGRRETCNMGDIRWG